MFLHDNLPSREVSELLSGQGIKSLRNLLLIKYHNYWYSRLETSPCAPGHLQIVLKRNIFSLKDLTLAEWLEIHSILMNAPDFIRTINLEKSYERALDEYYGLTHPALLIKALHNISKIKTTDSYTIAVNYGATAGSEAGQLVLDIIPRYKGDVPEPKGGFRKMFFE